MRMLRIMDGQITHRRFISPDVNTPDSAIVRISWWGLFRLQHLIDDGESGWMDLSGVTLWARARRMRSLGDGLCDA